MLEAGYELGEVVDLGKMLEEVVNDMLKILVKTIQSKHTGLRLSLGSDHRRCSDSRSTWSGWSGAGTGMEASPSSDGDS